MTMSSHSRGQKRQSTLTGFFTNKKPKYIGFSKDSKPIATKQRSLGSSFAVEVEKSSDVSDDDDVFIVSEKRSSFNCNFSSQSNASSKFRSPVTSTTSLTSPTSETKTTMNSLTTEKSVNRFKMMESSFSANRPRLAKPLSRVSSVNNKQLTRTNSASTANGEIVLSEEQKKVVNLVISEKKNIFFTGSAGTGKSVLLKEIISRLLREYRNPDLVAITASTGLAAVNIGGQTLHRFAGIGIGRDEAKVLASKIQKNENSRNRWRFAKVLIIDEISMVDEQLFSKLEKVARLVRKTDKPFGGLQVIFTGDFFQLPPVPDRFSKQQTRYCFQSPVWSEVVNHTILLTKVFRQKGDNELIEMLNTIRLGSCPPNITQKFIKLAREVHYSDNIQPTELYPTRNEVSAANSTRLNNLKGITRTFDAQDNFTSTNPNIIDMQKKLLDNLLCIPKLILKEGAQVLMLKNNDESIVNGSSGIVITFLPEFLFSSMKSDYSDEDFLFEGDHLDQIKFIASCVGIEDQQAIKDKLQTFSKESRTKMKSYIQQALDAKRKDAYPVVAFVVPGNEQKKVRLVVPEEFTVTVPKAFQSSSMGDDKKVSRIQIPLILSWAISIHKSQGQTLDRVKVDLNKIFEKGQVYVALSRATSKERLQVLNFRPEKIKASDAVIQFYKGLQTF